MSKVLIVSEFWWPWGRGGVLATHLITKILAFSELYGFRPVILRLFNVYGPKQSRAYAGVIIEFIKRVFRNEPPVIFGDGEQTRDFVHVSDVVNAIMLVLGNDKARGVYNIGSGVATSINELAKIILNVMGREDLKPIYAPSRPGDIKHSVADITRAIKELNYRQTWISGMG
jgi:nucleoside-diphosphate-sugar epimerase